MVVSVLPTVPVVVVVAVEVVVRQQVAVALVVQGGGDSVAICRGGPAEADCNHCKMNWT